MSGGFKKNVRLRAPDVVGSRVSAENAQLLVSSGSPDVDALLGGGLAVGTLMLVEEDPQGSYANLLGRLFLAEGAAVGHPLFVASKNCDPDALVKNLPPAIEATEVPAEPSGAGDQLKIAWRYQQMPGGAEPTGRPAPFGRHFDLSRSLTPEAATALRVTCWTGGAEPTNQSEEDWPSEFQSLLESIKQATSAADCWAAGPAGGGQRTVLRVALLSLGSPLWGPQRKRLPALLATLRALLRSACAVGFVTVPSHLLQPEIASRCRRAVDTAVRLEPAEQVERKPQPLLTSLHGLFKLLKLPLVNSVTPPTPPTLDLGYKVGRRKFAVEKLQLPVELADSGEREQDDPVAPKMNSTLTGCGTGSNKKLDF